MIKRGDCAFQDGSYPCGYEDGGKLPDCDLCHKIRKATIKEMVAVSLADICLKHRKAGRDDATRDFLKYAQSGELDKRFEELKQVGRREVVEWLEQYAIHGSQVTLDCVLIDLKAHSPYGKPSKRRRG